MRATSGDWLFYCILKLNINFMRVRHCCMMHVVVVYYTRTRLWNTTQYAFTDFGERHLTNTELIIHETTTYITQLTPTNRRHTTDKHTHTTDTQTLWSNNQKYVYKRQQIELKVHMAHSRVPPWFLHVCECYTCCVCYVVCIVLYVMWPLWVVHPQTNITQLRCTAKQPSVISIIHHHDAANAKNAGKTKIRLRKNTLNTRPCFSATGLQATLELEAWSKNTRIY